MTEACSLIFMMIVLSLFISVCVQVRDRDDVRSLVARLKFSRRAGECNDKLSDNNVTESDDESERERRKTQSLRLAELGTKQTTIVSSYDDAPPHSQRKFVETHQDSNIDEFQTEL